MKYPEKVECWPDRIAAVRHPERVGCRLDRIAVVRHPEKVRYQPDRIAAVRHPEKVECWPDRIATVRHLGGISENFCMGRMSDVTRRKGGGLRGQGRESHVAIFGEDPTTSNSRIY